MAVIGGSGLYSLFPASSSESFTVDTPYGPTSSPVTVGELGGKRVAFLTRHGSDHSVPPHLIGYRANVWALASLGATAIVSSSAVGGVHPDYAPGTFVVTDQFIDRTWGRPDTFFEGATADGAGSVQHLAAADPFDPALRRAAIEALTAEGLPLRSSGTCVVIQGPRFSTRAESLWYRQAGAHTVNMTMAPEVPLALELNLGTVNLSFVTDGDAGSAPAASAPGDLDGDGSGADEVVSAELVMRRLADAQPRIVAAIERIVRALPADYSPRELIPAAAVADVLAHPVSGAPRPPA
ncbi:5'-methylthioadenosine phosphorylase [Frondihabitans sp. PAMC 28766]|uniref:MTAP family purine nucleoside phosphorylase n=1 Tax=Frondihabitans sp. PAMC 28766 TaxID=1795630 RepID=UPI00078B9215|nr:MTAP family purine nucleoside phosphorylase [Frondihabitans sp. PAMC 28766]AMM20145.1 5'-methylthioadenosine phosphorylase [Frondihabitans sp. PAMC 28766]